MAFWFCRLSAAELSLYLVLLCFLLVVIGEDSDFAPVPSVSYWGFLSLYCHCIIVTPVWPLYSQMFAIISVPFALASSIWRRASLRTHVELQLFALSAESSKTDRSGTAAWFYRGYKHLPLNSGILIVVPTLAPGLWLGQNDHHRWPSKIFSPKSGVVNQTKGAIKSIDPLHQTQGSTRLIFWWQRKKVDFDQSWTWGDSIGFWRSCHSTCWACQTFWV